MASNDKCKINTLEALLALDRCDHSSDENAIACTNVILQSLGLSDMDLQAYVDGELSSEKAEKLEKVLPFYPLLEKRCKAIHDQNKMLKNWWAVFKKPH